MTEGAACASGGTGGRPIGLDHGCRWRERRACGSHTNAVIATSSSKTTETTTARVRPLVNADRARPRV